MKSTIKNTSLHAAFLTGLLGVFIAGPAVADELVMTTVASELDGTNDILDGDYLTGIEKSLVWVNVGFKNAKLAAMTNLCIGYTATRQYDDAVKWCDAAVAIGRQTALTKNNRAVLYYRMGDYEQSAALFSEALKDGGNRFPQVARHYNSEVIDMKLAQIEMESKAESFAGTEQP